MRITIFDIINPIKLHKAMKLSIDSIALKDDIYYIKTIDDFNYMLDKALLRRMCLYDKSNTCAKAFRQLKNKQLITVDGIVDIDDINIINTELTEEQRLLKEEGIYIPKEYRTRAAAAGDVDLSIESIEDKKVKPNFDTYTFSDMYQYILRTDNKCAYLYDILSDKFNEEYNTEEDQRRFFEHLSLKSHAIFADVYRNRCKLHKIQEDIWLRKSKEQGINIDEISESIYNTDEKLSNVYIESLYNTKLITEEERDLAIRINEIIYILLSVNLKHMRFSSMDSLDIILKAVDHTEYISRNTKLQRILRLTEEEILELIDQYETLAEELRRIEKKTTVFIKKG